VNRCTRSWYRPTEGGRDPTGTLKGKKELKLKKANPRVKKINI
jgi:hypothetical protein